MLAHAITWACGTARKLGISWEVERGVQIDSHTIYAEAWIATCRDGRCFVCEDARDFVRFVREEQRASRI